MTADVLTQQCRHHQHQAEALQLHRAAASRTLLVAAGQFVPRGVPGPLVQQSASWGHCRQQGTDIYAGPYIQQHCTERQGRV